MVCIFTVIILETETSQVTGCELGRQLSIPHKGRKAFISLGLTKDLPLSFDFQRLFLQRKNSWSMS